MGPVVNVPAGWYADTNRPGSERYWDGLGWTHQTREAITPPPPPPLDAEPAGGSDEVDLFALSDETFAEFCRVGLNCGEDTTPALVALRTSAARSIEMYQSVIKQYEDSNGKMTYVNAFALRLLIDSAQDMDRASHDPAVQALGDALLRDFRRLVIPGMSFAGVSEQQAWERFAHEIVLFAQDEIEGPRRRLMETVITIEEELPMDIPASLTAAVMKDLQ